jgi:uroporphyrinogen-III synthase
VTRGRVVLTASSGAFPGLAAALRAMPVTVEELPLMSFVAPLDWQPVDDALGRLVDFEAVALTSPRAAEAVAGRVRALGVDRLGKRGGRPSVWASGAATAAALGEALGPARLPDERAVGELGAAAALARAMLDDGIAGPILFPCGELRRDELPARLRHEGIVVEEVVCYRSVLAGEAEARKAGEGAAVLIVASPSVADLLARACPPGVRPALLAVGPTTAAAARASGWTPAGIAQRPSTDALAAAVRSLLATG